MSQNGLPYTKSMQGFISAEFGWTKDDEGNSVWNLWEKWETKEDFEKYDATPPRTEVSEFGKIFSDCAAGVPSQLWIDGYQRFLKSPYGSLTQKSPRRINFGGNICKYFEQISEEERVQNCLQ